jgi:hypothetical protein
MGSEENKSNETTDDKTPDNAGQAGASTITPEMKALIDEAVQRERHAIFAEARRTFENRGETKQTKTKPTDDRAFEDTLADALGDHQLSREQRAMVRKMARSEKPDDIDSYVTSMAKLFGVAKQETKPDAKLSEKPADKQPGSHAPAGPDVHAQTGEPVFRSILDDDERARVWKAYVRQKGATPSDPYHPSNRAVWKELRKMAEAEGATTRVNTKARLG